MGIATVVQFRAVKANFGEWKAWLHMIGKYKRHDLGDDDHRVRKSRYMENGMQAIDSWCKRHQYRFPKGPLRDAYNNKRWNPSKIGHFPEDWAYTGPETHDNICIASNTMSVTPLYIWSRVFKDAGVKLQTIEALVFLLFYSDTLFPEDRPQQELDDALELINSETS